MKDGGLDLEISKSMCGEAFLQINEIELSDPFSIIFQHRKWIIWPIYYREMTISNRLRPWNGMVHKTA